MRVTSGRVRDREAIDPEQFLNAALWVEPLLIGLAGLVTINLVPLGVRLDISDGERQRGWVAWPEQHAVDSGSNELGERSMGRRDGRDACGHGLHGNEAERLFPSGGQQDRTRMRDQLGAPAT